MVGSTFYTGDLIVGFNSWKLQAMGFTSRYKKPAAESVISRCRHRRARSSIYQISDIDNVDDVNVMSLED